MSKISFTSFLIIFFHFPNIWNVSLIPNVCRKYLQFPPILYRQKKKIVYLPFYISVAFEQIQRFQNDKPCFKKRMTLEQATRTEGSVSNLYLEWNAHHDCSLASTAIKAHQAAEPCPPLLIKRRVISLNFHELFFGRRVRAFKEMGLILSVNKATLEKPNRMLIGNMPLSPSIVLSL